MRYSVGKPKKKFSGASARPYQAEDVQVKRITILVGLIAMVAFLLSSCGGTPAIGNLRTITLSASPTSNLVGQGGLVQLQALGVYSTGNSQDITRRVTFTATPVGSDDLGNPLPAPPNTVTFNPTGLVTAVAPFVCTWIDTTPSGSSATWAIVGSYQFTASYNGITSQPVFVTVASAVGSTDPKGGCGP
jgi:hypothetical protein